MKAKVLIAALAMALMFAGAAVATEGDQYFCSEFEEFTLWGGKTNDVGKVTVFTDGVNLIVTYHTTGDWYLKELHLYVLNYEPTKRLVPGQAPYKAEPYPLTQEYTFVIPLSLDQCESGIWLQAHAAVVKIVDGKVVQGETAYGGEITDPRRGAWYGNIYYYLKCCHDTPPNGECKEETAWGGNDSGGGNAWWYYYDALVGGVQIIWAGQDIDVGTAKVESGVVYITLTGGWELQDVEESVKIQGYNDIPDKRPVPGQFSYKGTDLEVYIGDFAFYAIHLDVQLCE